MTRPRPVFLWYGSKWNLAPWVVSHFPPRKIYVEPFGGSAAVLLAKPQSAVEVYNDIDSGLVNFFRVLRDTEQSKRLQELLENTPYSREEFHSCKASWADESDPVLKAWAWYFVASSSFSGNFGSSWSYGTTLSRNGMGQAVSAWRGRCAALGTTSERLRRVQIDHRNWDNVIDVYDGPDTLFYLDPPYVLAERRTADGYAHNFTDDDHDALIQRLLALRGIAVLSGYDSPRYSPLADAGWSSVRKSIPSLAVAKTKNAGKGQGVLSNQYRTEVLWISPTKNV